jgi:cobalt/nickel transport system permease protein
VRLIDRNAQTNRWRRLPAGDKAALALGMMIVSLCTPGWAVQGIIILVMWVCLLGGARVPLRDALTCAAIPLGFIAASSVAQVISLHLAHGIPVVGVSSASLEPAARVALRSFACVSALLWLALTTPLTDILQMLRRFGLGHEISDIALMMFRFIWLTLDCLESGVHSQANRLGYVGYRRGLRSTGLLMASLLPRVLGRARRLENGLAARGYSGELRFIQVNRPTSRPRQLGIVTLLVAVAVFGRMMP